MPSDPLPPRIAIACGGTGGHLYPGLAVADCLLQQGAAVTLMVAERDLDRRVLEGDRRFRVATLPAVGFSLRGALPFVLRSWRSYRQARREFRAAPPAVVLSMGGFTSAPPALAGRSAGAEIALHEANAIPGRANRWLSRWAQRRYLFFPEAAARLSGGNARVVGMPVREGIRECDPVSCRTALGLSPSGPVLLVMGGSQGASGINRRILKALPRVTAQVPDWQVLHLTGDRDETSVREGYRAAGVRAVVRAFLTEMEWALGAADFAVARAGASSLAEFAAMRIPALLIPFPYAADDHQRANALALARTGAAAVIHETDATEERLSAELIRWLQDPGGRARLRNGVSAWHRPNAALDLADDLLRLARREAPKEALAHMPSASAHRPTAV